MRNILKSLPLGAEFTIVVVGAFGLMIAFSLAAMFVPAGATLHSEPRLWRLVSYELGALLILGAFLNLRGWTRERLGLRPRWSDLPVSLGLAGWAYLTYYLGWYLIAYAAPSLLHGARSVPFLSSVSPWTVAAVTLVNPVFEEVFVSGYVVASLKGVRSPIFAINVSVVIRLLYHLYQGVTAVFAIIPMGLIFAYWFARKGRLWPLIGAHAIMNLLGLVYYLRH
jgi:membrane protease YdiL (CAAX protease family)